MQPQNKVEGRPVRLPNQGEGHGLNRFPWASGRAGGASAGGGRPPRGSGAHAQPTYSSPIALSPNERLLWVVNPDDDSVTIINTANNAVLDTIEVGDEPRSVAIDSATTSPSSPTPPAARSPCCRS